MGTTYSKDAISRTRETIDPKFLEAMERLAEYAPLAIPEGAFSTKEAGDEWGIATNTASKRLRKMYDEGILDRVHRDNNKMYYFFKENTDE